MDNKILAPIAGPFPGIPAGGFSRNFIFGNLDKFGDGFIR